MNVLLFVGLYRRQLRRVFAVLPWRGPQHQRHFHRHPGLGCDPPHLELAVIADASEQALVSPGAPGRV